MTSRRKKRKKKRAGKKRNAQRPTESKGSEAVTIAWTLTVTTVLVCDLGALAAMLYVDARPEALYISTLFELLLFAAVTIGVISLMLLPVVLKVRRQPPPRAFTLFAVLVAVAPLVAVIARAAK